MAGTEVLTRQLIDVASKVEDTMRNYDSSVNKMYNIGAELDVMWDGNANDKFNATMKNDRAKFTALKELVTKYIEVLRQNVDTYVKAEDNVIDVLNTNKFRLI